MGAAAVGVIITRRWLTVLLFRGILLVAYVVFMEGRAPIVVAVKDNDFVLHGRR